MYRYLTLFLILLAACNGGSNSKDTTSSQLPKVVKCIVATSSEIIEKDFAGLSTPELEVNLAFKVAGQVLDIPVITGEEVAKGSILAQLDPRDLELTVAADRSSYEQAKARYDRSIRLLEHEAISKQESESAESTYTRSKTTYENSLDLLEQASLVAPFKAVIERIYVQEYQRIQAGESVIRVVAPTTNQVSFTLPENMLAAIKDSTTTFRIRFDNYPEDNFKASILEYAQSSSDASGFPVKLHFENFAPERLYINPGLSCNITMIIEQRDIGAIIVPLSSIYAPINGGTYVWIVDGKDNVELRKVTLGDAVGSGSVIVNSGVKNGERIVSAGVYQLHNNQKVKVLK